MLYYVFVSLHYVILYPHIFISCLIYIPEPSYTYIYLSLYICAIIDGTIEFEFTRKNK